MDLAVGYESIGKISLAREAFSRARAAYPASAQVAWIYGNFLLRQGDAAGGFAQIKYALQADSKLVPIGFNHHSASRSTTRHSDCRNGLIWIQVSPSSILISLRGDAAGRI